MIFIEKMKNLRLYKTESFLPTLKTDKKKGSAIVMLTPHFESSKKVMNNKMFVNSNRFSSYYLEKDVSYYINSKVIEEVDESAIINDLYEADEILEETKRSELPDDAFGVPSKRKFPLDTEAHVRSAIKFFNYVDPEDEEELARRIKAAMKKFNITDVHVSDKNRFSKYYANPKNESVLTEGKVFDILPRYHNIYADLDLYYTMWKNGVLSEAVAREKILRVMKINLCISCEATTKDVPSIKEYYTGRGLVAENYEAEYCEDYLTENLLRNLPSDTLNLGDKVLFFNEANTSDAQLKRILYRDRIRKRMEILALYDKVKSEIPWIKFTNPELSKYKKRNVYIDLYYYNSIFFENNKWIAKRGLNLYVDFMVRLLNHPNIKQAGYTKKTIFIPVKDWDKTHDGMIWNYRKSINPISCIYELMFNNRLADLKKIFGDNEVIFLAEDKYFKINFSQLDAKEIRKLAVKFKFFCIKICKNEEFDQDDIDTSADNKEDSEVIAAKIVDKIEKAKGIDLTKHVAASQLKVADRKKQITKAANSTKPIPTPDKYKYAVVNPNMTTQDIKKADKLEKDIRKTLQDVDDKSEDYEIPDIDEEKERDASKLADAIANASELDSEDDAMDELDNDEIKAILVSLGSDDEVNISAARSSRMSKLDQDLLNKEINGRSIKDILEPKEEKQEDLLSVNVAGPENNKEEWKDLSFVNLDKNYDIDKDIISIFRMFANTSRPMVVKDIKVTDNSTSEDRLMLYDVQMEDYKGRRYRIKLDIPIMEDNRFLLRGDFKSIQTQFFNMPIIKTEADTCQLISNYKKIFLRRFGDNRGRSLPAVAKFLKACNKYAGRNLKITNGVNTKISAKYTLPMDYIDLSADLSTIESKDWIIYFNQDEIRDKYTVEPEKGIPFLYNKKLKAVEYFDYITPNTTFIGELCNIVLNYDNEFKDLFESVTRASGCGYSRASLMAQKIPVVVLCAYHVGLSNTMDRAGIKYEIVDKLTKEIRSDFNKDWIEFDDGYVVYEVNYESSMLMSGLKTKTCPTEMFSVKDIDNKNMYLEFLDNFGSRMIADGLDNFRDLFVDPMIKESLEYYNLPTDYIDILLYGSALLADSKFIKHGDTSSRRMRRYQLISVYTYQVLSRAYDKYLIMDKHNAGAPIFAVKQSEVVDAFLTDTITSDDSFLNALRDVETTNAVTTKGPSGMNADRAYTLDKRSYDDSMINVLGMSTGFAGNVGITRQTTINPNVTPDGYVKDTKDKDMNDSSTLTATENLIPFGSTRDDPMRTAMSFIQTSKHMVRTEDSDPLLVTSGADEALPYITTNRFAYKAKWDGVVLEITDTYMLVQKTGDTKTKDYINLEETIEKNSDGGYYVPLKLDPADGMKKGVKFTKDQILAYDRYSFSNKLGESNDIAYNIGKLAKVAILNTDEGFEDSGIISSRMAQKLATRVDLKFDCIIDKDSKVYKIAKVGDHIEASDDLIIWENAFDDASAAGLMDVLAKDSDFSEIGKKKLKSEVTGTITAIKIYRTVELDELSPSLKKIVSAYEKPLKDKAKLLADNGITNVRVPAHTKLSPTGKLKKSQDAVFIEFYVEYLDTVGIGDKIVYNAANKAVEKAIFPEGKEPYTAFRPNETIDAMLADSSVSKRLISSIFLYGSIQKLMVELDRSVKDIMGIEYDDSEV